MGPRKVLKRIKSNIEEVEMDTIYLFGSRARGNHMSDSDLDLAIVSEDFEGVSRNDRYMLVIDDVREITEDTPVDVVCYTPEEFEDGKDAFLPGIIEEEGISV